MKKRFWAGALVAVMLISAMVVSAAAATSDEAGDNVVAETIQEMESKAACVHTPGVHIATNWKDSPDYDPFVHCYYEVRWETVQCAKCKTPYSYETDSINMRMHTKEFVQGDNGVVKGFRCTNCNYCSWKALPGAPVEVLGCTEEAVS